MISRTLARISRFAQFTRMSSDALSFPHHVFLYGTLKTGEPNHDVLTDTENGEAVLVGKARTVRKWPLVIASSYNIPYLLYCEGEGHHVHGELYKVNEKMLATLDNLECHPTYYERVMEEVFIQGENTVVKSGIYFLKKYKSSLLSKQHLKSYSSRGDHGQEYVPSENTSVVDDIDS